MEQDTIENPYTILWRNHDDRIYSWLVYAKTKVIALDKFRKTHDDWITPIAIGELGHELYQVYQTKFSISEHHFHI